MRIVPHSVHATTVLPGRDVPYVPTEAPVVGGLMSFAQVTGDDVLYDLGCGDGRIVVAAAKLYGARAVGVEIDPELVARCRRNADEAGVADRVKFLCRSFFDVDLREATVVALYLLPEVNVRLRPKLLTELRPGSRIVASTFSMGDWSPDAHRQAHYRTMYKWIVPAFLPERWRCSLVRPGGGGREAMFLELHRKYQVVSGVAKLGGKEHPLINARLAGARLTFTLPVPGGKVTHFTGDYAEGHLRGTFSVKHSDEPPGAWVATAVATA